MWSVKYNSVHASNLRAVTLESTHKKVSKTVGAGRQHDILSGAKNALAFHNFCSLSGHIPAKT